MTGKRIKRYKEVLLLMCLFILFSVLSGCDRSDDISSLSGESGNNEETVIPVSVAMYSGESLDPYTTKNMTNRNIISLCYPGLFMLDSSWTAVPFLAEDFSFSGNMITISISGQAFFSDGSPVTAADCVFSFDKAKEDSSVFSSRFSYIQSYSAVSENQFLVEFSTVSANNVNLLDIPIVKSETDGSVGAGAYVLKLSPSSDGSDGFSLYPNVYFLLKDVSSAEKIDIIKYETQEEMLYAFNYGSVHAMYADISLGKEKYRGNTELSSFTTNNFVFAYINPTSRFFSNRAEVSRGITYAINRSEIASDVFGGEVSAVWFPFNPTWEKTVLAQLNDDIYSEDLARTSFYNARLYVNNGVLEWFGEPVKIRIIVNNDSFSKVEVAMKIAEQLNEFGFDAIVETLPWEKYLVAVEEGNYDIYIAEIKMPPNMDVFSVESALGVEFSPEMKEAVVLFNEGKIDMLEFMSVFSSEMPFIPLYYTKGALALNRSVKGLFAPSENNLFFNIDEWRVEP